MKRRKFGSRKITSGTNRHDERQWDDNDDRTDDNTGITKGCDEWDWEDDGMTEIDSGITGGYNEKL